MARLLRSSAMQFREYNLIELFSSIIHVRFACPCARGGPSRPDISIYKMWMDPRMLMAVISFDKTGGTRARGSQKQRRVRAEAVAADCGKDQVRLGARRRVWLEDVPRACCPSAPRNVVQLQRAWALEFTYLLHCFQPAHSPGWQPPPLP